jgi:hypothetical protein
LTTAKNGISAYTDSIDNDYNQSAGAIDRIEVIDTNPDPDLVEKGSSFCRKRQALQILLHHS